MARPQKDGLLYFPFDVDFFGDRKIRSLGGRYGPQGITLYIYILCMVYSEKGYYADIDDDFWDIITADLRIAENTARQILKYLCERSMLDGTLFASVKILTSVKIQENFQEAKKGLKRDIKVNPEYWLLNSEETLSFIKFTQNEGFSEKNGSYSKKNEGFSEKNDTKESKVNKIKENKSKAEESNSVAAAVYDEALEKVINEYESNIAPITKLVRNNIIDWIKSVETDVIIYAIHEAVEHSARNWSYINAILKNHFNAGRTTLHEVTQAGKYHKSNPDGLSVYKDETGFDYDSIEKIMQERYDND